ncbi:hypothetical protein DR095_00015 [Mycoplasma flocculare]|uniref:Smr domain-containing protein n=2 Tax=Mesomycoplasma flocculare TaxID=2128 RepID=A0A0A8E6P9_MESFC|nr:hypothetical protein [Mesomycoplasma flocculare]MXR39297.1 hypothetical protein [Mycoplasma sp. MF12]AJC49668.1 hypothetical protein MYF_00500 [Mesomycoplasma flocculare ATCC 27399]ENX51056.1 hypothetical protein MFC_01383 [Mesomycoplasma flocculare ATCC 27716]MXR05711.1 hypothetical protein [Mesomycoplasma flocculare]MXR12081.1 hypothetical protein [Mesomycoplasma flocculare]
MNFSKKSKKIHFGDWDRILETVENSDSEQNIENFYPYNEKSFDFHGFDSQKTTAIVENLIFELNNYNSKIRCINLIAGIGFGHIYEQILDSLKHYSSQFNINLQKPATIRVCKK